jgi:hypothetical protein
VKRSAPVRRPLATHLPDDPHAHALSLEELERLRDQIRGSLDRTQADIEKIEALIVAAKLRDERRVTEAAARDVREMAQE